MRPKKSKERLTNILMSFDEGAEIHGYRETRGTIEFFGKDGTALTPSYAAVGPGYERDSGKFKLTSQIRVDPTNITAGVNELMQQYDTVYAVDTNAVVIDEKRVCVSCAVKADIKFEANKWNVHIQLQDALVFCNPTMTINPELIGWIDLITRVNADKSARLGVVVDSELSRLPAINLRKEQIIDGYTLPENITLIYASSERDTNSPFNFIINKCDFYATLLIEKMKKDSTRLNKLAVSAGYLYEASFYWAPKRSDQA